MLLLPPRAAGHMLVEAICPLPHIAFGLHALVLLQLLHVDVPPDPDARQTKRHEAGARDDHLALDVGVGADDGVAFGRAVCVRHLHGDVAEDGGGLVLAGLGQALVQLAR